MVWLRNKKNNLITLLLPNSLNCMYRNEFAFSSPQPAITWYKDGIEISEEDPDKVVQDFGRELAIQELWATDGGLYECKGYTESDSRSEFHSITLRIEGKMFYMRGFTTFLKLGLGTC